MANEIVENSALIDPIKHNIYKTYNTVGPLAQIEYLKDKTTGDIVWPPDAQLHCHPLPWSYAVIAVEEKEARRKSRLRWDP